MLVIIVNKEKPFPSGACQNLRLMSVSITLFAVLPTQTILNMSM